MKRQFILLIFVAAGFRPAAGSASDPSPQDTRVATPTSETASAGNGPRDRVGPLPISPLRLPALGKFRASDASPRIRRLREDLEGGDRFRAIEAIAELQGMGAAGAAALVEALEGPTHDPAIRFSIVRALGSIGPPAVPPLAQSLHPSGLKSSVADQIFRQWGPRAAAATPHLVRTLLDSTADKQYRLEAAALLESLGVGARAALPQLMDFFEQEQDAELRRAVLSVIVRTGELPLHRTNSLLTCLTDETQDPWLRAAAAQVLARERPLPPPLLPTLDRLLRSDQDDETWIAALDTVAHLGAEAVSTVPAVLGRVDHESPDVRDAAARALVGIARETQQVVATLVQQLRSDDAETRAQACRALAAIGPLARSAAPALVQLLKEPGQGAGHLQAVDVLAVIRPDPALVVRPLVAVALNGAASEELRIAATRALGELGRDAAPAIPALATVLSRPDEATRMRRAAASALGKIGPLSVAALRRGMVTFDPEVRIASAGALAVCDPDSSEATHLLIAALADEATAEQASEALAAVGSRAVPPLSNLLHNTRASNSHREAAARTLGRIGPAAVATLIATLSAEEEPVVQAAETALREMGPNPTVTPLLEAIHRHTQSPRSRPDPRSQAIVRRMQSLIVQVSGALGGDLLANTGNRVDRVASSPPRIADASRPPALPSSTSPPPAWPPSVLIRPPQPTDPLVSAVEPTPATEVPPVAVADLPAGPSDAAPATTPPDNTAPATSLPELNPPDSEPSSGTWTPPIRLAPTPAIPESAIPVTETPATEIPATEIPEAAAPEDTAIRPATPVRAGAPQVDAGSDAKRPGSAAAGSGNKEHATHSTQSARAPQLVKVFYGTNRKPLESLHERRLIEHRSFLPMLYIGISTMLFSAISLVLSRSWFKAILACFGLVVTIVLAYPATQTTLGWERAAKERPGPVYGVQSTSSIERGVCEVSLPPDHRYGELESPLLLRFEIKQDPARHIVVASVRRAERDRFLAEMRQDMAQRGASALVFVHGYNVSFDDAARRTAQLSVDLEFPGVPVFFSWPSQGNWYEYREDEKQVELAVDPLKRFLREIARDSGARSIHLVAHSMGSRALVAALKEIEVASEGSTCFKQLVLAAPDIDADVFRQRIAPAILPKVQRLTLYASSNDLALIASRSFNSGDPRAGDSSSGLVVLPGIETIDVSNVDTSLLGHSYYGDSPTVLTDIKELLLNALPADQRPDLEPKQLDQLRYWEFRQVEMARRRDSTTEAR